MQRFRRYILAYIAFIGILDALYLSYEHWLGRIPPCGPQSFFSDCGGVLTSPYATPLGIPLAYIGVVFYLLEFIILLSTNNKLSRRLAVITTTGGFVASLMFVYIMVVVIGGICLYCLGSAVISTILFILVQRWFVLERKEIIAVLFAFLYRITAKPLLFSIDPERIHRVMVTIGRISGEFWPMKRLIAYCFQVTHPDLHKTIAGITFPNPVGLAAGYDYHADLTQVLSSVGFGFQSVGTITNSPYEGNPRPMLGRLPKSKSLMVNKGYKNLGADATIRKLTGISFPIPVGISIGVTNSSSMNTLEKVIDDILACFQKFEQSTVQHAYYELNISCPNLKVDVSLYPPASLDQLLKSLDALKLSRPVFIKMPIEKSDQEYKSMLDVILKHKIAGVIIGNLAKDRKNPALNPEEVKQFSVGNFSGKPTWESSNHLIATTRKYVKNKLIIIGCGGIFSPEDAQVKLDAGADMLQLITGMIYSGPQLIGSINHHLIETHYE